MWKQRGCLHWYTRVHYGPQSPHWLNTQFDCLLQSLTLQWRLCQQPFLQHVSYKRGVLEQCLVVSVWWVSGNPCKPSQENEKPHNRHLHKHLASYSHTYQSHIVKIRVLLPHRVELHHNRVSLLPGCSCCIHSKGLVLSAVAREEYISLDYVITLGMEVKHNPKATHDPSRSLSSFWPGGPNLLLNPSRLLGPSGFSSALTKRAIGSWLVIGLFTVTVHRTW